MDFETFYANVGGQESGGNYEAQNARTGAYGKFQIMPDNWPKWSTEVFGSEVEQTPENQEAVARAKLKELYDAYGPEGALVGWYAGATNAERWVNGEPDAIGVNGHYSWDAAQGNGDEPSIRQYVQQTMGRSGGTWDLPGNSSGNAFGVQPGAIPTKEPESLTFGDYLKNKWETGFFDNYLAGQGRALWAGLTSPIDPNYQPSQEDYNYVTKALPNDPVAQRWALFNAHSQEGLYKLVAMKQQDVDREQRIQNYAGNWATNVAGFGANLIGSIMGDPTVLAPVVGQEALGLKMIGALGTETAAALSTSKLLKYAEIGAQQAGLNVASRYGAEVGAGFQQDYTTAALLGAAAGSGLTALSDLFRRGNPRFSSTRDVLGAVDNMESHALTMAGDMEPPNALPKLKDKLEGAHDADFVNSSGSPLLSQLAGDGKVLAVGRDALEPLAKKLGINMEATKAFHVPDENLTVLLKDNLKPEDNIDNLLAHEIGVHANLKETIGDDAYNSLAQTVQDRMANPDKSWQAAMKAVPGGGWEETLGHWVERNINKKDSLMDQIKGAYNQVAAAAGRKTSMTDSEIKDMVKRSLKNEVDRARGYKELPDGSTIYNGIKYSASNIFNPSIISDVVDIEPKVGLGANLKDIPNKFSRWTEKGWLYKTPYGVLTNSPSPIGRDFAANMLEDARMRPKAAGALPISIEKQRAHIKNALDFHLNKFYETREKYLHDTLLSDGPPTPARMQDFNKMVREYYNAEHAENFGGLAEREYPQAVKDAAGVIKDLRDDQIAFAKKSGDMFGLPGHNILPADYKVLDDELWRRIDDQRWLKFMQKFPTIEAAEDFLKNYAHGTIKRSVVKERLEIAAKKAYEDRVAKWEEATENLKEGEKPPGKPRLSKVSEDQVEAEAGKLAENWARGISDQNLSNLDRFKGIDKHSLGLEEFMESRVPMDTSVVMETPWGEPFSFDASLRSDNLDEIMPRIINRYAGELALHNRYLDTAAMVEDRAKFAQALEHGVQYQVISAAERDTNLQAWEQAIADIRGVRRDQDTKGALNAVVTMLKGMSYAENGSNFGANQLGELGGAIGVSGYKAALHFIPSFANLMRDVRAGKGAAEFAKDAEQRVFGETLEKRVWGQDYTSRVWAEASTQGSILRHMDKINTSINFAAKVMSTLNLLPKLTDMMLRGIRQDAILDTIKWAGGERVGVLRNPFSTGKLKAAGISGDYVQKLKDALNTFVERDSQGNLKNFMQDEWMKTDPDTYWRWVTLVDNQSQRALTQHTIGNKALVVNQNAFTKLFFQFKDFTLKVMNSQAARIFTHRELDDGLSILLSGITNTAVYAGLAWGKSYAYFGFNNEGQRKEYLKRALSPGRLGAAFILRGTLGTAISFATDAYEAITNSPSIRTTVARDPKVQTIKQPSASDVVGQYTAQLPAIRSATDIVGAANSAYKLAFAQKKSQQDIKQLFRIMPLQNSYPMVRLSEYLADTSGLPKKTHDKPEKYNPNVDLKGWW